MYKLKRSLYRHRTLECGQEPRYECPHCPYRGKQKVHVTTHVNIKHAVAAVENSQSEENVGLLDKLNSLQISKTSDNSCVYEKMLQQNGPCGPM